MFCVIVRVPNKSPRQLPLAPGPNLVGRDPSASIRVDEEGISRRHLVLEVGRTCVTLRDLGSKNGCFVDGRRVAGEELRPGARIVVGRVELLLVEAASDEVILLPGGEALPRLANSDSGVGPLDERALSTFLDELTVLVRSQALGEPTGMLLPRALALLAREAGGGRALAFEFENGEWTLLAATSSGAAIVSRTVLDSVRLQGEPLLVTRLADDPRFRDAESLDEGRSEEGAFVLPLEGSDGRGVTFVELPRGVVPSEAARRGCRLVSSWIASVLFSEEALQRERRRRESAEQERLRLRERLGGRETRLLGISGAISRLREILPSLASSDSSVLIRGESGTGKELVAEAIHAGSRRANGAFIAINCAAIPEALVESELFGIERGVATGVEPREGRFRQAHGGTLFLDEIGDLPLPAQAKILRVLETKEVAPVGGKRPLACDARIVSATHRNLESAVAAGSFREDLYWRLKVVELEIPPLRQRPEDVVPLAQHFLASLSEEMGKPAGGFTVEALRALSRHDWPGNVRELRNVVERALVLSTGGSICAKHLPRELLRGEERRCEGELPETSSFLDSRWNDAKEAFERSYLLAQLERARGNISEASRQSGIGWRNLYTKLQRHDLVGRAEELRRKGKE